ncbi:MAG: patatin-like phospholipase family protein [Geobacteraceae bacterium]|nr:patatin-like phospholipase family protein [Geobacteraceae bacterium]
MSNQPQSKVAFVLAGGGSLGAVQVGMLRTLLSHGIRPDLVVGSSVGAINGAYFAADPTIEGVKRLERIWLGLQRRQVFPFSLLQGLFRILMQRDYLLEPAGLRLLIEKHLTFQRLEDAAIPCHVVATDIIGGGEVRLSTGSAVDALLASTAIPTIFPPVRIGGQFLVDGGIANNTPISTAADLGATRMIVLPTGFACAIDRPPRGAIAIALHAMNLIVARQLVHDMERLACAAELVAVPPLCPLTVSPYDLSQSAELIDRAAEETRRWIGEGGLERGGVPASLCPHSHQAMSK